MGRDSLVSEEFWCACRIVRKCCEISRHSAKLLASPVLEARAGSALTVPRATMGKTDTKKVTSAASKKEVRTLLDLDFACIAS